MVCHPHRGEDDGADQEHGTGKRRHLPHADEAVFGRKSHDAGHDGNEDKPLGADKGEEHGASLVWTWHAT